MAVELVERTNGNTTEVATATSASEMKIRLQEMKLKISLVQSFFRDVMVEGEDYGLIPGTEKPTLLKAGAEKLCEFYGYSIHVQTEREEKDRETGYYDCAVKVTLISRRTGEVIAEGVGEANTMEARYRWRWVWPSEVPAGLDKTTLKTRQVKTKNGTAIQYRIENDDPWSLWNTVRKMAKKRALIDAVLSATRSSGIFTQDLEDLREWAAQGDIIDAEYTVEESAKSEPLPRKQMKRRAQEAAGPKGGDESKREDYHALLLAYLSKTHAIDQAQYVSFIDHAIGGSPISCDIDRLAELARYAYGAAEKGSKTAADHIARIVEEWRRAQSSESGPDDVPFADSRESEQNEIPF